MAKTYLETSGITHAFETYSEENIRAELEQRRATLEEKRTRGEDVAEIAEQESKIAEYERFLEKYKDEFGVLYRIAQEGAEDASEGKSVRFHMEEVDYRRPEIEPEKSETLGRTSQLELKCTFEDGLTFGLSALDAAPRNASETNPMVGQINFDEETLKNLNEERLRRIFSFCERYGFSTFGLSVPMKGGEIDVDEKLAELNAQYQAEQERARLSKTPTAITEDKDDYTGMRAEDYHIIFSPKEFTAHTAPKRDVTLDQVLGNMEKFLEGDLKKRKGLSYWRSQKTVDGLNTYVFSIYDKENSKNFQNDGLENNGEYKATYSARLYVAQDKEGVIHFGYATPNAAPLNATLAGQIMGQVKKTGATHVNLAEVSGNDQTTLMLAAAEKGLVPTGVNIDVAKAKQMLEKIGKLSGEEQAEFKDRLADQMLENARKNNKDAEPPQYGLPDSEFDFIQDLKEKSQDEASNIAALPIKRKFKNFKDAVEDRGPSGLYTKMKKTAEQGKADREKGAATICGAAHAFNAVFDLYFKHFDETLGQRIAPMLENGEITKEEFIKLAPLSSKVLGQMNSQDFALIYDVLLPRKIKQTEEDILEAYKLRYAENSTDTRPPANILQQDIFPKAKDALAEVNRRLKSESIPELYIPFENKVMSYAVPEYLRPKKKKEETSKPAVSKPDTTREGR